VQNISCLRGGDIIMHYKTSRLKCNEHIIMHFCWHIFANCTSHGFFGWHDVNYALPKISPNYDMWSLQNSPKLSAVFCGVFVNCTLHGGLWKLPLVERDAYAGPTFTTEGGSRVQELSQSARFLSSDREPKVQVFLKKCKNSIQSASVFELKCTTQIPLFLVTHPTEHKLTIPYCKSK
jgi:hypothetical protein